MRKFTDVVQARSGTALPGATVTVRVANVNPGTGALATIYSDDGITTIAGSAVTTDTNGRYFFYAADGRYDLTITGTGITTLTLSDTGEGGEVLYAKKINEVRYADQYSSIQAAMDDCPSNGCKVKIPSGTYTITSALSPGVSGIFLECDNPGVSNFGTIGTVIRTSGAIWAFQNPTPTASVRNHVGISNCVFDLSGNASALGGLNLRSIAYSKFDNVSVILPSAGAMEAFRFDAQDAAFGGFWNECFHCTVLSSGTGLTNTHIGFRWINGANNDNLFGGQVYGVNTAFKLESADHISIYGTAGEGFSNGLWLAGTGNSVTSNFLAPGRLESVLAGAQAITISAGSYNNTIIAKPVAFADAGHELSDLSLGKNELHIDSSNGFGSFHTWGNTSNTGKFGFNMTGTQTGIEVAGVVASTRATGNVADFKGTSGTQAFFAGASDTYGSARVGTSSNDPVAFFTNNAERARFSPTGTFSITGQLNSTLATGTAPFAVASSTPVNTLRVTNHPLLNSCAGTNPCTGAFTSGGQVAYDGGANYTLSAGTLTVTGFTFSASNSFGCIAINQTTGGNKVVATNNSGSSVTFTGTGTDAFRFICMGS